MSVTTFEEERIETNPFNFPAALILIFVAIVANPASAAGENSIAFAAGAVLGGIPTDVQPAAERIPTVGALAKPDASTPAGVPVEPLAVLAAEIASTVPVDADVLLEASLTTSTQRLRVMLTALAQVGTACLNPCCEASDDFDDHERCRESERDTEWSLMAAAADRAMALSPLVVDQSDNLATASAPDRLIILALLPRQLKAAGTASGWRSEERRVGKE